MAEQAEQIEIDLSKLNDDSRLTRAQAAAALTLSGFPTAEATLARKACVGGGPKFMKFGTSRVLYRWADLLTWAQSRLSRAVTSTSELRAA